MLDGTGRIPTFVVTGFLGSGKTTLLRGVLHDPAFANTAVIVNEFGAVGLDHELLAHAQERTILMPGGCVCCSIREDVETTLRELLDRVNSGLCRDLIAWSSRRRVWRILCRSSSPCMPARSPRRD